MNQEKPTLWEPKLQGGMQLTQLRKTAAQADILQTLAPRPRGSQLLPTLPTNLSLNERKVDTSNVIYYFPFSL
jgi:hypothetical protein